MKISKSWSAESGSYLTKDDLEGKRIIFYRAKNKKFVGSRGKIGAIDLGWWQIPSARANTAQFLIIVEVDSVKEVRLISNWEESSVKPGRFRCVSDPTDILDHLLGKQVNALYNPRDKSVLRFYNC